MRGGMRRIRPKRKLLPGRPAELPIGHYPSYLQHFQPGPGLNFTQMNSRRYESATPVCSIEQFLLISSCYNKRSVEGDHPLGVSFNTEAWRREIRRSTRSPC
jgi:hypothetical protein